MRRGKKIARPSPSNDEKLKASRKLVNQKGVFSRFAKASTNF